MAISTVVLVLGEYSSTSTRCDVMERGLDIVPVCLLLVSCQCIAVHDGGACRGSMPLLAAHSVQLSVAHKALLPF